MKKLNHLYKPLSDLLKYLHSFISLYDKSFSLVNRPDLCEYISPLGIPHTIMKQEDIKTCFSCVKTICSIF